MTTKNRISNVTCLSGILGSSSLCHTLYENDITSYVKVAFHDTSINHVTIHNCYSDDGEKWKH